MAGVGRGLGPEPTPPPQQVSLATPRPAQSSRPHCKGPRARSRSRGWRRWGHARCGAGMHGSDDMAVVGRGAGPEPTPPLEQVSLLTLPPAQLRRLHRERPGQARLVSVYLKLYKSAARRPLRLFRVRLELIVA